MDPLEIVPAFDEFLASRGLSFEGVIIGGAALVLLGVIQRTTDDCDVLDPQIPMQVLAAARDFGAKHGISPEWLNGVALAPTLEQLRAAWPFVVQYEGNADSREQYWVPLARRQLSRLKKELGYDAVF